MIATEHNALGLLGRIRALAPALIRGAMLLAATAFISSAPASDLSRFSVFALGPLDGRAVFKYPDGKMAILKLGGTLAGTDARLVQVLSDRAVLEDLRRNDGRPPMRDLVWLFKANTDGRSEEKRFSLEPPPPPVVQVPK